MYRVKCRLLGDEINHHANENTEHLINVYTASKICPPRI